MGSTVLLPPLWGRAWLYAEPGTAAPGVTRSYDHLGRQLVWQPPSLPAACDIERPSPSAGAMAARFGLDEPAFLRCWVEAEVRAKLADQPILLWLKAHGLCGRPKFGGREACILVQETAADGTLMAFGFVAPDSQ